MDFFLTIDFHPFIFVNTINGPQCLQQIIPNTCTRLFSLNIATKAPATSTQALFISLNQCTAYIEKYHEQILTWNCEDCKRGGLFHILSFIRLLFGRCQLENTLWSEPPRKRAIPLEDAAHKSNCLSLRASNSM